MRATLVSAYPVFRDRYRGWHNFYRVTSLSDATDHYRGVGAEHVNEAFGAVCMLCGRNLGYRVQGRFFVQPGSPKPERQGQVLRCGACGGTVLFETDPTRALPEWLVEAMQRVLARPAQQAGGTE